MFGNLRFITILDHFVLPNQVDLSAHCFYYFLTSIVLGLRCSNTEISVLKFKLGNLMKNPLFMIAFLNNPNTLVISPSQFWLSHV